MNFVIGAVFGYIIHDALQPTSVGKVLDKVSLPADLFTNKEEVADAS